GPRLWRATLALGYPLSPPAPRVIYCEEPVIPSPSMRPTAAPARGRSEGSRTESPSQRRGAGPTFARGPFAPRRRAVKPPRSRINRRQLLGGLGGRGRATAPSAPVAQPSGRFDLLRASRPAMGSYFEVRLPARAPGAPGLAGRALDLIDELESQLTVYR